MSFDIFLARFERGVLAEAPREAVWDVLRARQHTGPDEFGFYVVQMEGHDSVEFSARDLQGQGPFQKCAFHVRRFSGELAEFIFGVAKAGRFTVVPAMDGNPVILVEEGMSNDLPADMLETLRPVYVASARELGNALAEGFGAWAEYRDQVVGEVATPPESARGGPTSGRS